MLTIIRQPGEGEGLDITPNIKYAQSALRIELLKKDLMQKIYDIDLLIRVLQKLKSDYDNKIGDVQNNPWSNSATNDEFQKLKELSASLILAMCGIQDDQRNEIQRVNALAVAE